MLRPTWDGFLRLNLISIPVKAFPAYVSGGGRIGFHQIHAKCHSRIKYKKVCPIHGEVANNEIVPGYEVAKGQFVVFDPAELKQLRVQSDKSINIDVFVKPEALDPIYFGESSYYLTPDGPAGQKPYGVVKKIMAEEGRYAIATMVLSGKEQLVLIRPVGALLTVTVLRYADQVRKSSLLADEIENVPATPEELKLARTLVRASTNDKFDLSKFRDEYNAKVTELIDAKAAGKRLSAPPAKNEPHVINLMDALRKSLKKTKGSVVRDNGPANGRRAVASSRRAHGRKTG